MRRGLRHALEVKAEEILAAAVESILTSQGLGVGDGPTVGAQDGAPQVRVGDTSNNSGTCIAWAIDCSHVLSLVAAAMSGGEVPFFIAKCN